MKILTVAIPSYNVEKYLKYTLDSFIADEILESIEVLIIDDGSKDSTAKIAEEYEEKYPGIYRTISKENGGHGSAINRGIQEATGKYFKVVDGDDWVNTGDFAELVQKLKQSEAEFIVTDYFEVNDRTKEKKRIRFPGLKEKKLWKFEEIADMEPIPMHALVIRTDVLKENQIRMDEKCFYVDNEYTTFPVPYVKLVQYWELCVYEYRLAVATQSVSMKGFQKHIEDHIKVTKRLVQFAEDYSVSGGKENAEKLSYIRRRAAVMVGDQAGIFASFPAGDQNIKMQFMEFDKWIQRKSPEIYALSNERSRMLRALRKNGFKHYRFWVTVSKLGAKLQ